MGYFQKSLESNKDFFSWLLLRADDGAAGRKKKKKMKVISTGIESEKTSQQANPSKHFSSATSHSHVHRDLFKREIIP